MEKKVNLRQDKNWSEIAMKYICLFVIISALNAAPLKEFSLQYRESGKKLFDTVNDSIKCNNFSRARFILHKMADMPVTEIFTASEKGAARLILSQILMTNLGGKRDIQKAEQLLTEKDTDTQDKKL